MQHSRAELAHTPKATVRPLGVPSQVHDDEQRPTTRSRSPRWRQSPQHSQNLAIASQEKELSLAAPIEENQSDNGAMPRESSISKQPVAPTMASSSSSAPVIVEAPAIITEEILSYDSKLSPLELPPELRKVHPEILEVLVAHPNVIKVLQMHPDVMNNLNAETLTRLRELLEERAQGCGRLCVCGRFPCLSLGFLAPGPRAGGGAPPTEGKGKREKGKASAETGEGTPPEPKAEGEIPPTDGKGKGKKGKASAETGTGAPSPEQKAKGEAPPCDGKGIGKTCKAAAETSEGTEGLETFPPLEPQAQGEAPPVEGKGKGKSGKAAETVEGTDRAPPSEPKAECEAPPSDTTGKGKKGKAVAENTVATETTAPTEPMPQGPADEKDKGKKGKTAAETSDGPMAEGEAPPAEGKGKGMKRKAAEVGEGTESAPPPEPRAEGEAPPAEGKGNGKKGKAAAETGEGATERLLATEPMAEGAPTGADGKGTGSKLARDFDEGAIVRVVELPNASRLNGCLAQVQHFSREDGCYTLCMLSGNIDAKETLEPTCLVPLPLKEEVSALIAELSRFEVPSDSVFRSLMRLRDLPVDVPILKETRVGKIVNELTKKVGKLGNNEVAVNIGRQLVQTWRELYKGQQQELSKEKGGNISDLRTEAMSEGSVESNESGRSSSSLHPALQRAGPKKPSKVVSDRPTQVHHVERQSMGRSRSLRSPPSVISSPNTATASASQEDDSSAGVPLKGKPFSDDDDDDDAAMLSGGKPVSAALRYIRRLDTEQSRCIRTLCPQKSLLPTTADAPLIIIEDPPDTIEDQKTPQQDVPPELRNLCPVIQEELTSSPKLIKLLQKHLEVMTYFHADPVNRLTNLLERAKESEQLQQILGGDNVRSISDTEAAACRTVIVSSLPNDATAKDVETLFGQFGPVEVELPIESSKWKRHVGIAYVKLVDARIAAEAVRVINGRAFTAATDFQRSSTMIVASLAVGGCAKKKKACAERVHWKACDELWQQRMFNPHVSVSDRPLPSN